MGRPRRCAYQNRLRLRGDRCIYCGDLATAEDHWPPVAVTGEAGSGLLLPSCMECNAFAGAEFPYELRERMELVKRRLKTKYKKFLRHPEWSGKETRELSENLRREFRAWNEMKRVVNERLAWNAIDYFCLIAQGSDFVSLVARLGFSLGSEPRWLRLLRPCIESEPEPFIPSAVNLDLPPWEP
jgi:hypothetical protein